MHKFYATVPGDTAGLCVHIQRGRVCRHSASTSQGLWSRGVFAKSGVARSISNTFFRVGHTHNGVDQRFAVIAGLLAQQPVLQTPEDFVGVVDAGLPRVSSRDVHVEVLTGSHPCKFNVALCVCQP